MLAGQLGRQRRQRRRRHPLDREPPEHRHGDEGRREPETCDLPAEAPVSGQLARVDAREDPATEPDRHLLGARRLSDEAVQGRLGLENAAAGLAGREVLVRLQGGGDR